MPVTTKVFRGSYVELSERLEQSSITGKLSSQEDYVRDILKDIDRQSYCNPHGHIDQIKAQLLDTGTMQGAFSYIQGNWDARIFSANLYVQTRQFQDAPLPSDDTHGFGSFGIAYLNDAGVPCGFSVSYRRDDSNQDIPEDERKLLFIISHIENTHLPPEERRTHLLVSPELNLVKLNKNDWSIEKERLFDSLDSLSPDSALPFLIKNWLKSRYLSSFVDDLFVDNQLSREAVLALKERLPPNGNMDHRDTKIMAWHDIASLDPEATENEQNQWLFNQLEQNRDFFVDTYFQPAFDQLYYNTMRAQNDDQDRARLRLTYLIIKLEFMARKQERSLTEIKLLRTGFETLLAQLTTKTGQPASPEEEDQRFLDGIETFLLERIPSPKLDIPDQVKESFFSRNLYPLLTSSASIGLVIGIALSFSGILAPLTLGFAITAVAFSLVLLAASGLYIVYNEYKYVEACQNFEKYNLPNHRGEMKISLDSRACVQTMIARARSELAERQTRSILVDTNLDEDEDTSLLTDPAASQSSQGLGYIDEEDDSPLLSDLKARDKRARILTRTATVLSTSAPDMTAPVTKNNSPAKEGILGEPGVLSHAIQ